MAASRGGWLCRGAAFVLGLDDIEDRIIFQILKWRNDIAQSLERRGKEKTSNLTGLLCMTYSPHTWSPRGKKEIKRKDSCSGPVPGGWICCPTDMAEGWALREHTCSACCFFLTSACADSILLLSFVAQGGTGCHRHSLGRGCGSQHPALSGEGCLSGLF